MAENAKVADRLVEVLDAITCTGKQVHDANAVATMLVHGVDTVVTSNVEDFARFGSSVRVVSLSRCPVVVTRSHPRHPPRATGAQPPRRYGRGLTR